MIRGKKVMRPIRKLKIQDKADMNEDLIKDFIDENEELTLLMAVNCIVTLAEDSELSSSFFEKADRFITCWHSLSSRAQQAISLTSRMWQTI